MNKKIINRLKRFIEIDKLETLKMKAEIEYFEKMAEALKKPVQLKIEDAIKAAKGK
jgi:hypothetical protein